VTLPNVQDSRAHAISPGEHDLKKRLNIELTYKSKLSSYYSEQGPCHAKRYNSLIFLTTLTISG